MHAAAVQQISIRERVIRRESLWSQGANDYVETADN